MSGARAAITAAAAASMLGLALTSCTGTAPRPETIPANAAVKTGPAYYVSMGDSLAAGVQPTATGASRPTNGGYPDRIFAVLRAHRPSWRLIKLGCSGETTQSMIDGGSCSYPAGSQLREAERFLRDHRGHVGLITIDIGANDANDCIFGAVSLGRIATCLNSSVSHTEADLRHIMAGVRSAAGPTVPIIAMSYYVPELAGWLHGETGKEVAVLTERLVAAYNQLLARIYRHYGARVANVFGAFRSSDFRGTVRQPGIGPLPTNVATVCTWTWACAAPPRGPNEHANDAGYGAIARAFLQADKSLSH